MVRDVIRTAPYQPLQGTPPVPADTGRRAAGSPARHTKPSLQLLVGRPGVPSMP